MKPIFALPTESGTPFFSDITMFVWDTLQENQVIRMEVGEGSYKPYYLEAKGLRATGVYIRQGASSVPIRLLLSAVGCKAEKGKGNRPMVQLRFSTSGDANVE